MMGRERRRQRNGQGGRETSKRNRGKGKDPTQRRGREEEAEGRGHPSPGLMSLIYSIPLPLHHAQTHLSLFPSLPMSFFISYFPSH